ncbi:MAG: hypothetical protein A2845_02620 [Candidatus Lloydbacteria bacterium RIFCSPHIGHO2_01_FULL_49_22]|uniref:Type II secretion system protein n=1 Tax=Candidatus Lloydbacteria bacterium RIFCSPHIGHO2_01_FULL_49_22 TaxID=1798658 RepID=A0A1G2CWW8_9BACT|nr:MAG: hypothetical protein A2845_02620 [Candidatus Lloydbacteria bacterium RIFCSPHIGHO2_01_FULL_49_22]OGZ10342.1 MAG: hypothetical protein A3C14_02320 [Candidatus Lloydbacteria bacterium RIFCSPHIGHO2_02_FULL_50_18]
MKIYDMQKGFSLIEMIVYVAIFGVFVIGLMSFSAGLISARLHSQSVFEVNAQGSRAIKTITQTLRNASQVNSPAVGALGGLLSVITETPATSPTTFSASGGVLYVTEGVGAPIELTNNKVIISDLIFSNFSQPGTPNIVQVSFVLTSATTNAGAGIPYVVRFDGSGALRK